MPDRLTARQPAGVLRDLHLVRLRTADTRLDGLPVVRDEFDVGPDRRPHFRRPQLEPEPELMPGHDG